MVILNKAKTQVILIVEFKSKVNFDKVKKDRTKTKQHKKYAQFNVPILYCLHWTQIGQTIEAIKSMIDITNPLKGSFKA